MYVKIFSILKKKSPLFILNPSKNIEEQAIALIIIQYPISPTKEYNYYPKLS